MHARHPLTYVLSWLPDSSALPEADWASRHRVMTWVLGLHVPAIVGYALLRGMTPVHGLAEAALPALLLVVAVRSSSRLVSSLGVALGLITCSAVFVHLSGGLIEWHFHYFVTLALIALYQEWRVYAMALAFVVVQHALGSALRFNDVYNHGNGELWWALVHGAFVLAASASHIAAWRFNEIATQRAERFRRELQEGEQSMLSLAASAARIRSDLIASASHEFRTPLTAINGAVATLERYGDRLSPAERTSLLASISERSDRLSRLLESMLIASQVEPPQPDSEASIGEVLADLLATTSARVDVSVDPALRVACSAQPLRQLVERLLDCAVMHSAEDEPVRVTAVAEDDVVAIDVRTGVGSANPEALRGLVEPFFGPAFGAGHTWAAGLNLYAVRRIAEVHGGSLDVSVADEVLVIGARIPRARSALDATTAGTVAAELPSQHPVASARRSRVG